MLLEGYVGPGVANLPVQAFVGALSFDVNVDGEVVRLHNELDDEGRIRSTQLDRWGDPRNAGMFTHVPFGVEVTAYRTFGGVTIPGAGRAAWHIGTSDWDEGEFFRYEITDHEVLAR